MRKLCVIGDPIAHSLSPPIQTAMIRAAGLDCVYGANRVPGADTAQWLVQAQAEGYAGFNATMPHKEHLVPLMDELSADARLFQSVNTVYIRNGRIYGHSTDGDGFLRALREADMDPTDKSVLVLGAGGAAKPVVYKLLQGGATKVVVANRTRQRACDLCDQVGDSRVQPCDFSRETLRRYASQSRLVVNCTSLGMTGTQGQFEDVSFLEELQPGSGVYDLIYSPAQTRLLAQAQRLGHKVSNGLGMLIWQGFFSLEYFVDRSLDGSALTAAARQALEGVL